MSVAPDLPEILVCPETHQKLGEADEKIITALNDRVRSGQVRNRKGDIVRDLIEGGLIREDGQWIYPIRAGLPILLIDEAISVR